MKDIESNLIIKTSTLYYFWPEIDAANEIKNYQC